MAFILAEKLYSTYALWCMRRKIRPESFDDFAVMLCDRYPGAQLESRIVDGVEIMYFSGVQEKQVLA
jgi:hypothetical protein